ncbi:GNAT family N-acetyltransferase [Streptomyces flaveolus]|uniref:GNAT family N-acetyltransferase n=1 Tax=Streptomyces flaveolus TaxID=67297 RepID=UPI0037016AEB
MNDLRLRLAEDNDLATLVRLRDDAARWMPAEGITGQWQPGESGQDHFLGVMANGEVWLAEAGGRVAGAWELWWQDEDAWGPRPPVAGYVHRLMVDRASARPGTERALLRAAERRVAEAGREFVRLDCLAGSARLNAYDRTGVLNPASCPERPATAGSRRAPAASTERPVPCASSATDG